MFFEVKEIKDGAMLRFEKRDEEGNILSSFEIDPFDKQIPERMMSVAKYLKECSGKEVKTGADALMMVETLEDMLSQALGGNVRGSLFRHYTAIDKVEEGRLFINTVVRDVAEVMKKHITEHRSKMVDKILSIRK